jgi:hypothetical protein
MRVAGRANQFEYWQLTDGGLRQRHPGETVLVVINEASRSDRRIEDVTRFCRLFDDLRRADRVRVAGSLFRYGLFIGTGLRPPANENPDIRGCPVPARVILDQPVAGSRVSGVVEFAGWAFNNARGIARIELRVDGRPAGLAQYGLPRPDVFQAYPRSTDPNQPNVGFSLRWDSSTVAAGKHEIALSVISANGETEEYEQRSLDVSR